MDWKGAAFAILVAFAMFYAFVIANPLFLAKFSWGQPASAGQVSVTPYLPEAPSPSWTMTGLGYSCDGSGPGALEITNNGQAALTVVSVSLSYGGATYTDSGPQCSVAAGNSVIWITALAAPGTGTNSPYQGYVETSDGARVEFSGVWS